MPIVNTAITVVVHAYDLANNTWKTGDAANIALRCVADGVAGTLAGSVSEVDATNQPGAYKVAVAAGENTGTVMSVNGKSTTSDVLVIGTQWANGAAPLTATNIADFDLAAYEAGAKNGTKLGNFLAACRAAGVGKMTLAGTTLTLYEADNTTVLATATVPADYSSRGAPA